MFSELELTCLWQDWKVKAAVSNSGGAFDPLLMTLDADLRFKYYNNLADVSTTPLYPPLCCLTEACAKVRYQFRATPRRSRYVPEHMELYR